MVFPNNQFSHAWEGETIGDAAVEVTNEIFNEMIRRMITGTLRNDALILWDSNDVEGLALFVEEDSPPGLSVKVNSGSGILLGWFFNLRDDTIVSDFDANNDISLDDRIDILVARRTKSSQEIRLATVEGTVAASPVAPDPTQTDEVYEVVIAEITVRNGSTEILDSDIVMRTDIWAIKWPAPHGGTGLYVYTLGDLIAAVDEEHLGKISSFVDWAALRGDAALSPPYKLLDGRYSVAVNNGAFTLTGTGSVQNIPIDAIVGATYVTVTSNQLFFVVGSYRIANMGGFIARNNTGGARVTSVRLYNVTTTTIIWEHSISLADLATVTFELPDTIFAVTNAGHAYELQYTSAGAVVLGAWGANSTYGIWCAFERMK